METLKIRREPILNGELYRAPRDIRNILLAICVSILVYSFVFNSDNTLNILRPSQPGDFVGIALIIFCVAMGVRSIRKLTRPYEVIINEIGISCLDWTFTLLPWKRIEYLSEGVIHWGGTSIPVLKITLNKPLSKPVLLYNHSFLVRLINWSYRGNGAKDSPIILDMRGLTEDVSDVTAFLTIHYSKKLLDS